MRKLILLSAVLFGLVVLSRADHITGGEMYYRYAGLFNGLHQYDVTLKLFMRCNSGRTFANPNTVSIFDRLTGARIRDISVPLVTRETISMVNDNPCITDPPTVCYEVAYYHFAVLVPPSASGYVLASQVNYRINGISNLTGGYSNIGATYTAEIPGTTSAPTGAVNHGAHFTGSDLVIVCANHSFTYDFRAEDSDNDQLIYSFCEAYQSGGSNNGPAPPPPYQSVPYGSGFTSSSPLGDGVQINANTGLITGIAPPSGVYVVTVCVQEIRGGQVIATQRKDLQINITSCSIAAATLLPEYQLCKEETTIDIANLSTSPLINTYSWELLNANNVVIYSSAAQRLNYTFPDTGLYKIKLAINRGEACSDSTTSRARVYPGFVPDFDFVGVCFSKPTIFTDRTRSVYGTVNSWNWDFGENTTGTDVSFDQSPAYTYPFMGIKSVKLVATDSKGCRDEKLLDITILNKPPVDLAFRDTLICIPDAVQLVCAGNGNFTWSPSINIINPNSSNPIVSPITTTTYYVDMDEDGCKNRDSVLVRVTDHVSLNAMDDSLICQGDPVKLRIQSDGFRFIWSPASQLDDPFIANPIAITPSTTTYRVKTFIGSCSDSAEIKLTAIPYPIARAGEDTIVCFNEVAQLKGSSDGNTVSWSPASNLNNPRILNPIASPRVTTAYIMTVYDNKGCPKPGRDTVKVEVLPDINAYAGKDTAVIVGQPLQLRASGGTRYIWSPGLGLSAVNIPNPLAFFNGSFEKVNYRILVYNEAGCVDSTFLTVKIYSTPPSIFVPNAFTPNGDNKHERIKPIAAGISKIEYFRIYSRWGQLVFSGGLNDPGWDGKISGQLQNTGNYVWVVKAQDYKGQPYFQKGTFVLIR